MSEWQLTTEVNIFPTSEEFQEDPSVCTPAFDIVMDNGAHSPCYYGKQSEDPSTGYNFVNWDSYQAHMDVTDNPDIFPELQAALHPSLAGSPTMSHVTFSGEPLALNWAFTQVTKLILKPPYPETREAVKVLLSEIASKIGSQFVFGSTYEDGNTFFVICGQTSSDGSWENTSDTDLAALIEELLNLTDEDFDVHTALTSYAKTD